jgi:predicted transposase YdaD
MKASLFMSRDILKDTWIFQQVFNEGKEEGRQEGIREALEWVLVRCVEPRFPTLLALAKQVVEQNVPLEQLETMLDKLYLANTIEEAQSALVPNG